MPKPLNQLRRATLLLLICVIFVGYPMAIHLIGQERAIEIGNVLMFSLWSGIVVAYAPTAWAIARYPMLDGASILSLGIFLSGLSIVYRTCASIIWRLVGKPVDWLDSGWWGLHIAISCAAALCHLLGPEAMNGKVPTKEWIRIGIMVAFSVLAAGLLAMVNFE